MRMLNISFDTTDWQQVESIEHAGATGMAAYRSYRFHFIGFLKGLGFTVVGSLITAILWTLIQWLTVSG